MKHLVLLTAFALLSCKSESPKEDTASTDTPATSRTNTPESVEPASTPAPSAETPESVTASSDPFAVPPRPKNTPDPVLPKAPQPGMFKVAKAIPGKPGYVTNPFTGGEVDCRGIPAGSLVLDPKDRNPEHKFRIPGPLD
ncbi:MAG: hypothetical protein ACSHYF_15645 [Verrucomicrobiaceae bacterium]